LPATHLELVNTAVEFATHGMYRGQVRFSTMLPKSNEKVGYTDCSDIPYEVTLSNNEDFVVDERSRKLQGAAP
jgi:hypothetical protein